MSIDLTKLSEAELLDLNRRVVERLRLIRSARSLVQLAQFSVGMTVEFTSDDGRVIRGTIARLNRKTASICGPDGHWRVSPSLLREVALDAASSRPDVLPFDQARRRS